MHCAYGGLLPQGWRAGQTSSCSSWKSSPSVLSTRCSRDGGGVRLRESSAAARSSTPSAPSLLWAPFAASGAVGKSKMPSAHVASSLHVQRGTECGEAGLDRWDASTSVRCSRGGPMPLIPIARVPCEL